MTNKFIQIGAGPLGLKMIAMSRRRQSCICVGAVDTNPQLQGRDVGALLGQNPIGVKISGSIDEVIAEHAPDIAVVTTVSDMERITPLLVELAKKGLPVVSTCEELSFPWDESPDLAGQIDAAARAQDVAMLGTGVNPGFLMDSLPSFLTAVAEKVERIEVDRFQDAQFRRVPFQQKIGAGLSPEAFAAKKATGTLRHVGLTESIQFIARSLGWELDSCEDILTPVIADHRIEAGSLEIPKGFAAGVRQVGRGFVGGEERICLTFQAAVGEPESYDEVRIKGRPDIVSRIPGGVNGDIATCAITLNAIPSVLRAMPGLRTMADVPMISCQT